jgi:predicted transcriptional regulator
MLSVRPQWCELIANGQKTVEVRKNRPKIPTPFKCYIYCTLPPSTELFTHEHTREYANELIRLQDGKIVYGYGMQLVCNHGEYDSSNFLCRKVIGEFVCDKMYGIYYSMYPHDPLVFEEIGTLNRPDLQEKTCLSEVEIDDYLSGNNGYGWHISALQIYDKPKELSEFCKPIMPTGLRYEDDAIKRPPQSWCYVEELGDKPCKTKN